MSQSPSNILLMVGSLPASDDPDNVFRMKNSFIYDIMRHVATSHQVYQPLFVPCCAGLLKTAFRMRGLDVHFPAPRNETCGNIEIETVRYFHLPGSCIGRKALALASVLDRRPEKPDVIHCHMIYDLGLVGLELKQRLGVPLVVSVYGSDINLLFETGPARPSDEIVDGTLRVLRAADAVTCVSQALVERVVQLGVDRHKTCWIPNGVDMSIFHYGDIQQEKQRLGWSDERLNVLFVGNIYESKGLGDLVETVKLLVSEDNDLPDFFVRIAGRPNDYHSRLMNRIEELGLNARFEFLGLQTQQAVAGMMRASDLFCLPSWREGWPCVVLEAIACGCPVVVSDVGGIPEMVTGPEIGSMCPPRDPSALARILADAMKKSWDRQAIAKHAEPYSYDKLALHVEEVYRKVSR